MESPDVAEVRAAASGDLGAYDRLVRHSQGHLWRYLVHLTGDAAIAEDLRQEVFLKMYKKLPTLRDPERFVPWLLAMARNAAFDSNRSRKRRRALWFQTVESTPEVGVDPHVAVDVADALAHLDRDLREAIVLVGIVGLSYAEVAQTIGIPEGTVKSRVFRARQELSATLGETHD